MQRALRLLAMIALLGAGSEAGAATLTYHFSGVFTHDVAGGVARSMTDGRDIRLPSVNTGQSFHGTLSYSTNQPHGWNVTEHEGSFTLQDFLVTFGGSVLQMGIGPFGMYLQNNASGTDRISLAGADDTGFAMLNGETVRAITSISLVDLHGTALNSVVLGMLPELISFEQRRLQISISGYFDPYFGSMYDGELTSLTQTPVPAALPLFASALIGGGALRFWKSRPRKKVAVLRID
jgi:hypothetical protein